MSLYKNSNYKQQKRNEFGLSVRAEGVTLYQEVLTSAVPPTAPTPLTESRPTSTNHSVSPTPGLGPPNTLPNARSPLLRQTTGKSESFSSASGLTNMANHSHNAKHGHRSKSRFPPPPGMTQLPYFPDSQQQLQFLLQQQQLIQYQNASFYHQDQQARVPLGSLDRDLSPHFTLDPSFENPDDSGPTIDLDNDLDCDIHDGISDSWNDRSAHQRQKKQTPKRKQSVKKSQPLSQNQPRAQIPSSVSQTHPLDASAMGQSNQSIPVSPEVDHSFDGTTDDGKDRISGTYILHKSADDESHVHPIVHTSPLDASGHYQHPLLAQSAPTSRSNSRMNEHKRTPVFRGKRADSASLGDRDFSFISGIDFPDNDDNYGVMLNESTALQILPDTKRLESRSGIRNPIRATSPPPPSRTEIDSRFKVQSSKQRKNILKELEFRRSHNFNGTSTRSTLDEKGHSKANLDENEEEEEHSFDVGKTVALLLAAGQKQHKKLYSRGKVIFESMLADAQKKKEKMIADGVDPQTIRASTIQLELKAYDRAYQDIQKSRAAVTGAVTGAGQLALIPASVRVKDNYSLYVTVTTRGPDLDSIQAEISPRRRILLDYLVFLEKLRDQNAELGFMVNRIYTYMRNIVTDLPDQLKECSWKLQEMDGTIKELKDKLTAMNDERLNAEQTIRVKSQEVAVLQQRCEFLQHELEESYGRIRLHERERDKAMENVEDEKNNIKILEQQIRELMIANRNSNLHSQTIAKELEQVLLRCHQLEKDLAKLRSNEEKYEKDRGRDDDEESPRGNYADEKELLLKAQNVMLHMGKGRDDSDAGSNSDSSKSGLSKTGAKKKKKPTPLQVKKGGKVTGKKDDDASSTSVDEIQARLSKLQPGMSMEGSGDTNKKISIILERLIALEAAAGKKSMDNLPDNGQKPNTLTNAKRYIPYLDDIDRDPVFIKRGIRGVEWLVIMIETIYDEKMVNDVADITQGLEVDTLPDFVIGWSLQKKGNKKLARQFIWDVYASAKKFRRDNLSTYFFAEFLEERMDVEELTYFLRCRQLLMNTKFSTLGKQKEKTEPSFVEPKRITTHHCKGALQSILRHRNDEYIQGIIYKAQNYATTPSGTIGKSSVPPTPQGNQQAAFRTRRVSTQSIGMQGPSTVDMYEVLKLLMDEFQTQKAENMEKSAAFFRSMDTDSDGILTEAEFRAICTQMYPFVTQREALKLFTNAVCAAGKDGLDLDHLTQLPAKQFFHLRQHQFTVPIIELELESKELQQLPQVLSFRWQQLAPMWGMISSQYSESDPAMSIRVEDGVNQMHSDMKHSRYESAIQTYRTIVSNIMIFLNANQHSHSVKWENLGNELDASFSLIKHRALPPETPGST